MWLADGRNELFPSEILLGPSNCSQYDVVMLPQVVDDSTWVEALDVAFATRDLEDVTGVCTPHVDRTTVMMAMAAMMMMNL